MRFTRSGDVPAGGRLVEPVTTPEEDAVLIDPPVWSWHRTDEQGAPQLELVAARLQVRDAATARALRAYLEAKPATPVRTTVEVAL